jgi:GTP:adenosylcobinamide-phosphate guanylyltransferase
MYKIQNGKLVFTIDIADPNKDVYVTIAPEDTNKNTGGQIEDFKFNLATVSTSTTAVAGDVYNTSSNKAIDNVSCVWDATANRTTLVWDINTAMTNATKVEIAHRPDETQ